MSVLIAVVVLVLVLGVCAFVVAQRGTAQVTPVDVAWIVGARAGTSVPDDEADVVVRYLVRHRRHRLAGGVLGVVFAVVVGLRWNQSVGFGFSQGSPLADVLFCGVAGVLVGALAAEGYRLRPGPGARTALLEAHPPAPLATTVRAARVVLAASVLAGLVVASTGPAPAALVTAAVGAALVGVAELTRRRIVDRRRPVRSPRADHLDLRLRHFAAASVARLELAAALLTALWVWAWWSAATPDAGAALTAARTLVALAGLVGVVVLLVRAAPRAPRRALSAP